MVMRQPGAVSLPTRSAVPQYTSKRSRAKCQSKYNIKPDKIARNVYKQTQVMHEEETYILLKLDQIRQVLSPVIQLIHEKTLSHILIPFTTAVIKLLAD